MKPLLEMIPDWKSFLRDPVTDDKLESLLKRQRTGRPLGSEKFKNRLKLDLKRRLKRKKPGPKRRKV